MHNKVFVVFYLFLFSFQSWGLEFRASLTSKYGQVITALSQGRTPVAVFDLDETAVNTDQRMLVSTMTALSNLEGRYPQETRATRQLTIADFDALTNSYSISELLARVGIFNPNYLRELAASRFEYYLQPTYMHLDTPILCANYWVRNLLAFGFKVFFVSSRFDRYQHDSTLQSLYDNGFVSPGDNFEVLLRPDGMSSIDFKRNSFRYIADSLGDPNHPTGEVIYLFENEPENINAMVDQFPQANAYFVPGAFLKSEPLRSSITVFPTESYCD